MIFPVKAIAPPVIMAAPLLILLVLKPKSPAAVGTINAPEKMVSAMRSDWIMDWTFSARMMLNIPIISMMTLVFRIEFCCSSPFETGSLMMVAEVSNAVDAEDITAERSAAISNPTPHSGKVLIITGISAEPCD